VHEYGKAGEVGAGTLCPGGCGGDHHAAGTVQEQATSSTAHMYMTKQAEPYEQIIMHVRKLIGCMTRYKSQG